MRVRKDYVTLKAPLFDQVVSESSNARTRIHNDGVIIFASDLNARGITTVFDVFFPRNRDGAP